MRSVSCYKSYRKWEKVVQPLVKYNREHSKLGDPVNFFEQLQNQIAAGHPLQLNIATTLTGAKDNCVKTVFQTNEEVGRVVFAPAIMKSSFDTEIEKEMQERLAKFCQKDSQFEAFYNGLKNTNSMEQMLPIAVIKEMQNQGECRVLPLSKDEYKKMTTIESHQIAQGFILNSGKQSSIIRFFYYPNKHNSEAFKIDNIEGFMKRRYEKSQFKVRQRIQNSLTFLKIMYTNKSFYHQTLSLVEFLEKYQKIKINVIVTDWILDPHNRYYLIDVKEIACTDIKEDIKPLKPITDTLAYLTCDVCQQKFKQEEITKSLTNRLIYQFFQHLKKRQMDLSFSSPIKNTSNTSRICDLCYMLVVSQSQLIELERKIATITHSITPTQTASGNLLTGPKGKLFQWRLFLYIQDIRDLSIVGIDPKCNYYIMIRIHNSITSFKLKNPAEKYHSIKGIKVHYLFSEQNKIDRFLTNSQITIRITKGSNWNSVVAEGNTSSLYEESEKQSMRKFKQILVFNQKSQYSVVGMHIGVKLDGSYDPSYLSLHKTYDVYMVQDGYSNCYALPAQWMQTIDPSYCISKGQLTSFSYGLHLGQSQKKALLPSLIPKARKKLIL